MKKKQHYDPLKWKKRKKQINNTKTHVKMESIYKAKLMQLLLPIQEVKQQFQEFCSCRHRGTSATESKQFSRALFSFKKIFYTKNFLIFFFKQQTFQEPSSKSSGELNKKFFRFITQEKLLLLFFSIAFHPSLLQALKSSLHRTKQQNGR